MSSPSPHLLLAVHLDGAGAHPAAWREPDARPDGLFGAALWVDRVREAARGGLDLVTLDDAFALQPGGGDRVLGRLDAVLLACRIAPATADVGIVPTAVATHTDPFLASSQLATLDVVSGGRAGWLVGVPDDPADGAHVAWAVPPAAERFAEAAEHVEAVRRLWDSWEDDAAIRDAASDRFLDRDRVHHVDLEGRYLSVRGPAITPRPPQGQLPVVVATSDAASARFAVGCADLALVDPADAATRTALGDLPALGDLVVALDDDAGAAAARLERLDALAQTTTTGAFCGTPAELAELLLGWRADGLEGARLVPAALPHDLQQISRGLADVLRARGARPAAGPVGGTLRDRLGLARPASRYATPR